MLPVQIKKYAHLVIRVAGWIFSILGILMYVQLSSCPQYSENDIKKFDELMAREVLIGEQLLQNHKDLPQAVVMHIESYRQIAEKLPTVMALAFKSIDGFSKILLINCTLFVTVLIFPIIRNK